MAEEIDVEALRKHYDEMLSKPLFTPAAIVYPDKQIHMLFDILIELKKINQKLEKKQDG